MVEGARWWGEGGRTWRSMSRVRHRDPVIGQGGHGSRDSFFLRNGGATYTGALYIWVMVVLVVVIEGAVTQCENLAFF